MKVVIMAGGKGTRFWPRSLERKPKQFLYLTSERETMLQQAYQRFRSYLPQEDVYVAVSGGYLPLVREQLPELGDEQIILEPDQRDTGPCIALIAHYFLSRGIDDVLVTTPSDQYVPDAKELQQALQAAKNAAVETGSVVTLGVSPTRPETGYGYIETWESDELSEEIGVKVVKRFIEKPSLERAEQLFQMPNVYWNSGIFVWRPSTIAKYMLQYQPEMWKVFMGESERIHQAYQSLPKISIDFAILEKLNEIYMIPVHFTWDDVGTWTSLARVFEPDQDGNLTFGNIHKCFTSNSIIYVENQKVVVIGVNDLIIVSTRDGLLVCHKSDEQTIKRIITSPEFNEGG